MVIFARSSKQRVSAKGTAQAGVYQVRRVVESTSIPARSVIIGCRPAVEPAPTLICCAYNCVHLGGGSIETIEIRELKERASEIMRRVRDDGDVFEVSYHGRVIARLVPVNQPEAKNTLTDFADNWDQLTNAINAHWPEGVSAVDAVREGRREL